MKITSHIVNDEREVVVELSGTDSAEELKDFINKDNGCCNARITFEDANAMRLFNEVYSDLNAKNIDLDGDMNPQDIAALAALSKNADNSGSLNVCLQLENDSDKAVKQIADGLKVNNVITGLLLSSQNISDVGFQYIVDSLGKTNCLRHLNLFDNKITDKGLEYFSEALKNNPSLQSVVLFENPITPKGMKSFIEMLDYNSNLTSVDIDLPPALHEKVKTALNSNTRRADAKNMQYLGKR